MGQESAPAGAAARGPVNLAFIGLGRMGRGMALRLVDAGHALTVYDVATGATSAAVAAGATRAASIKDACRGRACVITMLVEDHAVLDAVLSPGGIRDCLPAGAIHIAMGTHGVDAIDALTDAHGAVGQRFVAAPVLGRPDVATAGTLGIITGGSPDATRDCVPVLEPLGRRVFPAGTDPHAATAIKLANNHLLGCAISATAEAFSLVRTLGAPAQDLYRLFAAAGLNGPAYTGYGRTMLDETFDSVGSPVTVGLKDALLIRAAAERVAVPMPSHNVYRDRLLGAVAHGHGHRDQAALALEQSRAAGPGAGPQQPAVLRDLVDDTRTQRALGVLKRLFGALEVNGPPDDPHDHAITALAWGELVACALEAMAEAFSLVRKYDVDPRVMLDVVTDGLFGTDGVYRLFGVDMLAPTPTGRPMVTIEEGLVIVDAVLSLADQARVPTPCLDASRDRLLGAVAHGYGRESWSALYREQLRAAGLL